jgi:hypothetical protein
MRSFRIEAKRVAGAKRTRLAVDTDEQAALEDLEADLVLGEAALADAGEARFADRLELGDGPLCLLGGSEYGQLADAVGMPENRAGGKSGRLVHGPSFAAIGAGVIEVNPKPRPQGLLHGIFGSTSS